MTYKEYISLRKKYMGTEINDNNIQNNTMHNIYPKKQEEKKQSLPMRNEEKINKYRSKSKGDKIKNFFWGGRDEKDSKNMEETKGYKTLYETNFDENGKEVLNENLFKYRKNEYKPMRKTFTGNFFQKKGSQQKDKKGEILFNYNNNINDKKNNNAYKSYYGGFKNANFIKKNKI